MTTTLEPIITDWIVLPEPKVALVPGEPFTVEVTQEHICHGCHGKSTTCPIALALMGLGLHFVGVGGDSASFNYEQNSYAPRWWFRLPPHARKFVDNFDAHIPVHPFSFTAEPRLQPGPFEIHH